MRFLARRFNKIGKEERIRAQNTEKRIAIELQIAQEREKLNHKIQELENLMNRLNQEGIQLNQNLTELK